MPPHGFELFEAVAQRLCVGKPCNAGLRALVRALDVQGVEVVELIGPPLASQNVESAIAQHGIEPAACLAARRIEARRLLPDAYECVVHRFLRQLAPPQDAHRDADHSGRLAIVDHLQASAFTRSTAAQRVIERWRGRLCEVS
ncbi:MAG: hypothetical protein JWL62_1480 [Hyphomicrobiales bacterium]|nr:hypothetical protein [Hyphomicrobiales bacterium]